MSKAIVLREISASDSKPYVVVEHGEAKSLDRGWNRKVLFVLDWFEKEDDARAFAHRHDNPSDY